MPDRLKIATINLFAATLGSFYRSPSHLRVLTFHDVGNEPEGLYTIGKQNFKDFLSLLKEEGYYAIRACDLAGRWPSILQNKRIVVLTFDDGYKSHYDLIPEYLSRHGMTATFFVITSLLSNARTQYKFDNRDHFFLCGKDIQDLDKAGFEIGSHSHTHKRFGTLSPHQIFLELKTSKDILEIELGHTITSFSYPFGGQFAFSAATRSTLEAIGYLIAFTQEGIHIESKTDVLEMPRVNIDRFDTMETFRRKLNGQYELFSYIRKYAKHS
jgi:peptidoglycan/xylan/chitin deacetylase (PgdA/CDA1 family)